MLITAVGIDKKNENKIELSAQVFIPKQSGGAMQQMEGGGGGKTLVRSAEGVTVADAMAKLQEMFPRRIFWGHDEVFIFGEKLAKEGIRGHVDFLMRQPQIRDRAYVLVSKKEAKEMLQLRPPIERSSAEVLREMSSQKTGLGVTLKELYQMLTSDAEAAALPWVEILPPEASGNGEKAETVPYIVGTAVFKKDKMIGKIDDEATRGVLWLRNEIKTAIATVKPNKGDGMISMNLLRAHTQLRPKIENDLWSITVMAETEDDVVQNTTSLDMMDPKVTSRLEKELGDEVEHHVKEALNQVQKKMKADIFGFAETFHRTYPDQWNKEKERWEQIFPMVEVRYDIKAYIRRPGEITLPVGPKEVNKK